MGMGYVACFDYVVNIDDIRKVCEKELADLEKVLNKYDVSMDNLAWSIEFDSELEELEESEAEEIFSHYNELVKAFKERTQITIGMRSHNQDEDGQRYDEVDGGFFTVNWDDIIERTPKAVKAKEMGIDISLKSWVSYG